MAGGQGLGSMGQSGVGSMGGDRFPSPLGPPVQQDSFGQGGTRTPPIFQGGGGQMGGSGVLGMGGEGPMPPAAPPILQDGPGSGFGPPKRSTPNPNAGGMVDAGYGTGPLNSAGQQAQAGPGGVMRMPPSMPAGIPPQIPGVSGAKMMATGGKLGGAEVNGRQASIGASPAASAQADMMKRAGVQALPPMGQVQQPGMVQKKQYPVPASSAPKPGA